MRDGHTMMHCAAARELLMFYPRADLPLETACALTEHVLSCAACRRELLGIQAENRAL
jgi:hypothetical protein